MFDKQAIQELAKAGAIDAAYSSLDGIGATSMLALPNDFTLHDLEKYFSERRRARGSMTTSVLASFAAYAEAHKDEGALVFVDQTAMSAVAVLNLGTPVNPGHADNRATFGPVQTAAFKALLAIRAKPHDQRTIAEFLEDWPGQIECFNGSTRINPPQAIAAVRKITIESARKVETSQQQLSAEQSALESVAAKSADPLPTTIYFKCVPYQEFAERVFILRLTIHTGGNVPMLAFHLVKAEEHDEQMAAELAEKVRGAIEGLPVLIGKYATTA